MPQTAPSFIDKLSFVKSWFSIKCETPWIIYVETGGKALWNLALSLLSFGWDDVARGFFKPKDIRSGRHGRKRKRRRKGGKAAIPEIGEGLYFWMLADVVTDFAFDWLSGILHDPASDCDNIARGYMEAFNVPLNGRDNWIAVPHGTTLYEKWPVSMNSQLIALGDGTFTIVHTAQVFNDQSAAAEVQLAIVRGGATWEWIGTSDRTSIGPFGHADLVASAWVEGPGTIILMLWSDHFVLLEWTSASAAGGAILQERTD
jgi:hypothetical protein